MTGNPLLDLLILAIPAALVGLWWTGSRAHELAIGHARQACDQQRLQFLDQSVALDRMRPARTTRGSSCFRRDYRFEFSSAGEYRDVGNVTMLGHRLLKVWFPYTRDNEGNRIYMH